MLLVQSGSPGRRGVLPLPSTIANGVYLLQCGAYHAQVAVIR
jgi:hypothetical protein